MGRAFVWRSQGVSPFEAVSLETFTQSEHRRRAGGSGAKSEKIDQASSWSTLFFCQIHGFCITFPLSLTFSTAWLVLRIKLSFRGFISVTECLHSKRK